MNDVSWQAEPEHDAVLESNWLFTLRRERFRSRNSGKAHDFYVVHLADAVSVVALTESRELLLVKQFRAGSLSDSLETPGGLLNEGEDPRVAGARELLEETGYAGDPARVINTVWSNPSIMDSKITTIVIENARKVAETAFDDHEEIEISKCAEAEIPSMIASGKIGHALVIQGLFAWMAVRDGMIKPV